jgi:tetratricopeptide (TPR) repeat protein
MAGALSPFWEAGGHIREGRQWLTRALAHPEPVSAAMRAKALWGAARLAGEYHGDHAVAITLLEECIGLYREVDNAKGLVLALSHLAGQLLRRGDFEEGLTTGEESVAEARALGDDWTLALALNNLGGLLSDVDDLPHATLVFDEALALRRSLGEKRGLAVTLTAFGSLLLAVRDLARARLLIEEGVSVAGELAHPYLLAMGIGNRGLVDLWDGRYAEAREAFADAFVRFVELGDELSAAESLSGLAATVAEAKPLLAARVWAAAEAACTSLGVRPSSDSRRIGEHFMPIARGLVSDGAWMEACGAGGALSIDQAFSAAVGGDPGPGRATTDLTG